MEDTELQSKYNQAYLEIIMRYKEYIEEKENLYVAELPKLVRPDDEKVVALAAKLKSNFALYDQDNLYDVVKLAYDYVKENIVVISLPLQFWLTPNLTLDIGAGDVFDKAILLCSVIVALGNPSSKVLVTTTGSERKFLVCLQLKDKFLAMDLEKGITEYENKEKLLSEFTAQASEDLTIYEFNDKMYVDLV